MRIPEAVPGDAPELKLTPLIDVVFLLLIFFIWTSSFETPEFDLPSLIGQTTAASADRVAMAAEVESFDEIVVGLAPRQGAVVVTMNGQPLDSFATLRLRLAEILALGVQPPIVIDPAGEITMGIAVAAYDIARAAGADRVCFAVDSP